MRSGAGRVGTPVAFSRRLVVGESRHRRFFALLAWKWQRKLALSTPAMWMLFVLFCLHEYGAAHAYLTPFGEWMRGAVPALANGRNPYDRLMHFLYGVLTVRAFFDVAGGTSKFQALQGVLSTSALYEVVEWLVAAIVDPTLGAEFVGAQGDDFDAAKDMALALCGALLMLPWLAQGRHGEDTPDHPE
jgi:putative membrane protein